MMREADEPIFDVAQLAHVEILTPKPDETVWFFTKLLGLQETTRAGQSVYLRAFEDTYHHTLKVTEAAAPGLGHVAWRTTSAPALRRRVAAVEATGLGLGWSEGDLGHGQAYRFQTPDGHAMELLWDVDYFDVPAGERSLLKSRPQRRPLQGVPVRRLDHVNLLTSEVTPNKQFLMDALGFRLRERRVRRDGTELATWLSVSALVHEIAFMRDPFGAHARFHHVAFWYSYPQHLYDVYDAFNDYGITVENGPAKHGISQAFFLYCYEPGGNRVELFGDAGYLIFDPSWECVTWTDDDLKSSVWIGQPHPPSFYSYGTPVIEAPVAPAPLQPVGD